MKHLRIDSQILTSFSRCPLRCNFNFIERLQSKHPNRHFEMGAMVHVGMEDYYKKLMEAVPFKDRVESAILSANVYGTTETSLEMKDVETVLRTLNEYFKYRRDDRLIPVHVEQPFSKVLYEGPDLLGQSITVLGEGKIDLVAEDELGMGVLDHKSTERNFPAFDLQNQFLFYNWATDNYSVTLNRVGFQTTVAPSDRFKRFRFKYDEQTRKDWKKFAIRKSLEYAKSLELGDWEQNFVSCEGNFGYSCNYINVCRFPSMAKETKEFEFNIGEIWDPMKEKNT